MKIWLGTAGWSYFPDWVGSFYPPGTTAADALARYVEAFRFVEVDSSFYAAPALSTVDRWADLMPAGFRAAFKAPKALVQDTGLRPPDVPFGHFCGSLLDRLGERVAAIVAQMPPSFARTPANREALSNFTRRWGREVPLAVELRHASWRIFETSEILSSHHTTWVSNDLQDVPGLGPGAHHTSHALGYLRLIGHHDGLSKDRIQRPQPVGRRYWADHLSTLATAGVDQAFVVVNNHYEGHAPASLRSLAVELHDAGLDIVDSPGWPNGQVSLF